MDNESLAAILAKRTPGCQVFGMAQANENECPTCAAIVAAVNACGPLLERVRTLEAEVERLRKLTYTRPWITDDVGSDDPARKPLCGACHDRGMVVVASGELEPCRSCGGSRLASIEAENARLLERVRELERLGLFNHRAAAIESRKRADAAEAQLAAANERVEELERCHKVMSEEVAKYIVLAGKRKNEVAALEDQLKRKRRASIVTPQIEAIESQLAAANERVRELERRERIADTIADAATGGAMNNLDRAIGLESQLAAANERVAELEGQVISLRVGSAACDQAADDDEEVIESLEAENKRLLERVRELEEHVIEIECENGSLLRQLAAANERIAEAERLLRRAISLDDGLDAQFQSIQEARKFLESKP